MAQVHLVEGPVGVGKSTFANALCKRHSGLHLDLDAWMANLFRPDRPVPGDMNGYLERKDRCIKQIWKLTCGLIEAGTDAILEPGLIQQANRQLLYNQLDDAGYTLTVYVLEASVEIRRQRVTERNIQKGDTYSMEVPDHFFELANNMWEPPDDIECVQRDIRFISTES